MNVQQRIVPHLWFDEEAMEAAEFYTAIFPSSNISDIMNLHNTPSGDPEIVSFTLWGYEFMAINGGSIFTMNPAISFMVNFDPFREANAEEMIDDIWEKLSEGGTVLMPFETYPFSKKYGWIQDKYDLSWQLILTDPEGEERPPIIPSFMFVGNNYGKAEEAMEHYLTIFRDGKQGCIARYPDGIDQDETGTIMFSDFNLLGQWFVAMDSGTKQPHHFNEAISFLVKCDTQKEIYYYWHRLTAVPEAEQCGWLKDEFGLSWQIVPQEQDNKMSSHSTPEQRAQVIQAILKMKKVDLEVLREAFYEGEA